jgi:undecaprenyl-diphosphatase
LSIPALLAAGALQSVSEFSNISTGVGWAPTLVATAVSFAVAYVTVAWLLKFIAGHTYTVFIAYRVVVGSLVLILVATGVITAT